MSKKDDEAEYGGIGGYEESVNMDVPKTSPTFCAIEEHALSLKISVPIFAAVKQYKGWTAGKKVSRSDFEKAVKDFLNAPAGGF